MTKDNEGGVRVQRTVRRQQPLKVWGGLIRVGYQGQLRTIVAATSQTKAAEALHCSLNELRGWWSVTGNKEELSVALSKPGQVFMQTARNGGYAPKLYVGNAWIDA